MVLQIWLWESSTVPDFYLRELKYSHCLSSFFLCFFWGDGCELGRGGAACETRRFCCIVILLMPEINFGINNIPIHHHPQFCKIRTVPLRLGTVPCGMLSILQAPLFYGALRMYSISSGSPPAAWWESSTALHNDWDWLETGFIRGASRIKRGWTSPSGWGQCLAGGKAVLRLKKSYERLRLSRCFASSRAFCGRAALHYERVFFYKGYAWGASRTKRRVERLSD